MIAIGKLGMVALWIWGIAAIIAPESIPAAEAGRFTVFALAGVHLLEFAAYARKLTAKGGSTAHHFLQTMIFGFLHIAGQVPRRKYP